MSQFRYYFRWQNCYYIFFFIDRWKFVILESSIKSGFADVVIRFFSCGNTGKKLNDEIHPRMLFDPLQLHFLNEKLKKNALLIIVYLLVSGISIVKLPYVIAGDLLNLTPPGPILFTATPCTCWVGTLFLFKRITSYEILLLYENSTRMSYTAEVQLYVRILGSVIKVDIVF